MARKYINPPELFDHPNYSRVVTVEGPAKLVFIAGQTPSDKNYKPLHRGDMAGQYQAVLEGLTIQLKAAGATWDDVVFRRMYTTDMQAFLKVHNDPAMHNKEPWSRDKRSPSTLIGVTTLSNPDFMIEVEIIAVVSQ